MWDSGETGELEVYGVSRGVCCKTWAFQVMTLRPDASQRRRVPQTTGLTIRSLPQQALMVPDLGQGEVLLRVDKFAFSHMALGYLMKGFTRTFGAYHNFYKCQEENLYRSACWGFMTVMESTHPKGLAEGFVKGRLTAS
eukprot:s5283_g3.t1